MAHQPQQASAYPLSWPEGWPRTPADKRRSSTVFSLDPQRTMKELREELVKLGATSIVVSSWLALGRDGQTLLGAARTRLEDPGVAVYFARGQDSYVMARDAYDSPLGNLRSIGLALEHLRGLERHGGAQIGQKAFHGFKALPPPEPPEKPWREVFGLGTALDALPPEAALASLESAYRAMAKIYHPDGRSPDPTRVTELSRAIRAAREELSPKEAPHG